MKTPFFGPHCFMYWARTRKATITVVTPRREKAYSQVCNQIYAKQRHTRTHTHLRTYASICKSSLAACVQVLRNRTRRHRNICIYIEREREREIEREQETEREREREGAIDRERERERERERRIRRINHSHFHICNRILP